MSLWYCDYCHFNTPWMFSLQHHQTRHKRHISYADCSIQLELSECAACNFQTALAAIFEKHCQSVCVGKNLCNCAKSKTEARISSIIDRWKSHNPAGASKCLSKDRKIERYQCQKRPCRTKHRADPSRHIGVNTSRCSISREKVDSARHARASSPKLYECNKDPYADKQEKKLKSQIQSKHATPNKIRWFLCEKCPFRTKWSGNLQKHVRLAHSDLNQIDWYQCEKCAYRTKWKGDLSRHLTVSHTNSADIKWYACSQCEYRCKQKAHLKRHVASVHADLTNHKFSQCSLCPFKCKYERNLKRHVMNKHVTK